MKNLDIEFKWRGKRRRILEGSIAWWTCMVGGALTIIGGMVSWYFLLYMMCPNPM